MAAKRKIWDVFYLKSLREKLEKRIVSICLEENCLNRQGCTCENQHIEVLII